MKTYKGKPARGYHHAFVQKISLKQSPRKSKCYILNLGICQNNAVIKNKTNALKHNTPPQLTNLDGSVMHGDDAGHYVHNPLGHNDHVGTQELCVEELHRAQVMQELHSLGQLEGGKNQYVYIIKNLKQNDC